MEVTTTKPKSNKERDPNKIFSKRNYYEKGKTLTPEMTDAIISNIILDITDNHYTDLFSKRNIKFNDIFTDLHDTICRIINADFITFSMIRNMYVAIIFALGATNDQEIKTIVKNSLIRYFKEILG